MGWMALGAGAAFLMSGAAIAYVIGATSVLAFLATDHTRYLAALPQRIFSQIDVFALMAVPLFILTGEIMNRAGLTRALVDLSMALIGRLRGGLGHVNILTSVFFAGISGSAIADAAALSTTVVPEMTDRGYAPPYAAALTAASSVVGPIIPPSIVLILYGAVMQTSVAALFVAGIVPGLLLAVVLMGVNGFMSRTIDVRPTACDAGLALGTATWRALPALSLPVIIIGGIVVGLMTPTESAAVAVVAAIVAGGCRRGLNIGIVQAALHSTVKLTGSTFIILGAAATLGYLGALLQWPQHLAQGMAEAGLDGGGFLLVMLGLFLLAGMVVDLPVTLFLIVPLLAPVALTQGLDPTHLGIVICFVLCIGLITPPLGICLIVTSTVTGVPYWQIARAVLPFVTAEIAVLLVLAFVPEISLFLPRLFGLTAA